MMQGKGISSHDEMELKLAGGEAIKAACSTKEEPEWQWRGKSQASRALFPTSRTTSGGRLCPAKVGLVLLKYIGVDQEAVWIISLMTANFACRVSVVKSGSVALPINTSIGRKDLPFLLMNSRAAMVRTPLPENADVPLSPFFEVSIFLMLRLM